MNKSIHLPLFLVSAALLSLEIVLMRILKVEGFGNFTYGAIALALTGFGASGTIICMVREKIRGREETVFFWSLICFVLLLGAGFFLSSKVRFDPLVIVWDRSQFPRLILRYLFYTLPFTAGSASVICGFLMMKSGRAYFLNLTGSSLGIAVVIVFLYILKPERILLVPLFLGCAGLTLYTVLERKRHISAVIGAGAVGCILLLLGDIKVLPYKGEQLALNLPDSRIIYSWIGPYGSLDVVESGKLRIAGGLSYRFEGSLPKQNAIFIDGDLLSAMDMIENRRLPDYLRFQVQSAAYILQNSPRVLIAGLGGGTPVERAFANGAEAVVVCEENPKLPTVMTRVFSRFNDGFFTDTSTSIRKTDARSLLVSGTDRFDIIDIPVIATSFGTVGGIYSPDTNYLLTIDGYSDYLNAITGHGVITATLPLKQPPRNLLKLTAVANAALLREGVDAATRIVVLRSWQFGTVLTKKTPFTDFEINTLKAFCNDMSFDLVYYPGIHPIEANRFNIVENAAYYTAVNRIIAGEDFEKNYLFNIDPPTDNRPYFSYFFRPGRIPHLFRTTGKKWLFVVEGGYIVLFATFIATVVIAAVLILLPPAILRFKIDARNSKTLLYFSLIAIGYMFVEVLLMQKFAKFIVNPLYSNSTIIAALLVFSGIGSFFSDRVDETRKRKTVLRITVFISVYFLSALLFGDRFFLLLIGTSLALKLAAAVALTAPAGFFMGFYFPAGLSSIRQDSAYSLAWAWSVNGFFSVLSSTGVVLVASNTGFLITGVIAICCYWLAVLFYPVRTTGGQSFFSKIL
jgi:hypothetical protein